MNTENPYAPPQSDVELLPPVTVKAAPIVDGPVGLGGWLIIVGLAVVLSPLRILVLLFQSYLPMFTDGRWNVLTDSASPQYIPLFGTFLIGEILVNGAFIAMFVVLSIKFFRKSLWFPKLFIIGLIANLVFIAGDAVLGSILLQTVDVFDAATGKEFARSLIGTLIWLPYMLVSKRVKNTFVE